MKKLKIASNVKSLQPDRYAGKILEEIAEGKQLLSLRKGARVFAQGDDANALYFIQSGRVKITIAAVPGKEAVLLALLGPRDFFGEGCLVGQPLRITSATTIEPCTIFEVQKRRMIEALRDKPALSEKFIASLLIRNIDMEQDIGNQLFNQTEKRLGRVLLKLSRYGHHDFLPDARLSRLSNETLAQLAGTTLARIVQLLAKFKRLGLVFYHDDGEIGVRSEMLSDMVLNV